MAPAKQEGAIMGTFSAWRWMRLWAGLGLAVVGAACTADRADTKTGVMQMALGAQGSLGNVYRLRQATFSITGPSSIALSSEDFLNESQIVVQLRTGDYSIALGSGYFLARPTP